MVHLFVFLQRHEQNGYNMKLIKGEFKERLELQFAQAVKAGFPSPAEDYMGETLDFNRDLIRNPEATFYALVDGDSMMDVGICKGDIAVIDRSIEPQHGDVVVGAIDREFTVKFLDLTHKAEGWIELRAANKKFSPFRIDETTDFRLWGVVIYTIKKWK
ncbi:MAG: translesion error-prone DNA polymerase V autoproteolytic subunit [Prevotella sp.]|nr:translesion error-prone DNA polymerase V autoproteolytic subunit [Prevotella sp.]